MPTTRTSWLSRVGLSFDDYKSASDKQEEIGSYIPLAAEWIELKHQIIGIAQDLGIGPEVSAVFDALKIQQAGQMAITAYGTAGGAAALGATAGVAAGVVGGAVVVLALVLGGSDDDEKASKQRRDAIRASFWKLLMRPSAGSLASEQDQIAQDAEGAAKALGAFGASYANEASRALAVAKTSRALARFYRLVEDTLSSSELALFLSALWVARLVALRDSIAALDSAQNSGGLLFSFWSQKQEAYMAFPTIDEEISSRLLAATAEFGALSKKKTTPKTKSTVAATLGYGALALGVGAASLYLFKPALATRLAQRGLGLVRRGASTATHAVTETAGDAIGGATKFVKGTL